MLDIRMKRVRTSQGVRLVPADALAEQAIADLSVRSGSELRCKITVSRSCPRNRWFHKLIQVVADAMGDPAWTLETLKTQLKVRAGLCDIFTIDGHEVRVPKSTAFAKMDETEFADFCDRAVRVVVTQFLPHVQRDDLLREVDDLLHGRAAA